MEQHGARSAQGVKSYGVVAGEVGEYRDARLTTASELLLGHRKGSLDHLAIAIDVSR